MRTRLDLQHLISIAALAVAVIAGPGRADAQSAEAEALFNDANKLMAEGKLVQACDTFEASNRSEPRAGTLIRLGECREQNQQLASAWSAYKDALTRVKDPRKRTVATAKAKALEPRLSYLTVSVPDDSRVDGLTLSRNGKSFDQILWNRALPVDGGDYVIAGRAPGHEEWQTLVRVPREGGKVSVDIPRFKELIKLTPPPTPPATPATPAATAPATVAAPPDDAAPRRGTFTTKRKLALGVAGVAAAGVVAGVVLGQSSKAKQDDAFKLCPDPRMACAQAARANALIQAGKSRALQANIAYGVAAAAAITAGVLWFTGAPEAEPRRVSVIPRVAPGEAGVVVLGRF